jgi:hypothetical protein
MISSCYLSIRHFFSVPLFRRKWICLENALLLSSKIKTAAGGIAFGFIVALKREIVNFRGSRGPRSRGSFWEEWSSGGTF